MQSLLVLYMTQQLLHPGHVEHVLGFAALRQVIESVTGPLSTGALALHVFGLYTGFVYLTPLLGGLAADRWLGRTAAISIGAILMATGHFLMTFDTTFLVAMALLLCGVGAFKGNIATQVGELYSSDDPRRATAYQIFQLSVSASVIAAPLICGTLGERVGWHYGFAAAVIGMILGLVIYLRSRQWLPKHEPISHSRGSGSSPLTASEWKDVAFLIALLPVLAATMIGNQQMFNTFLVWGSEVLDLNLGGVEMPVTWLLSFDAAISAVCLLLMIGA